MSSFPATFAKDVIHQPAKVQFEAFIDEHRTALNDCLTGLTEEQVRRSLVPSRTTLLGLVKHATLCRKSLVRRSHHVPFARRNRHPRDSGRVVHPR